MIHTKRILFLFISILFIHFLNAQVVNIEKKRKGDSDGFSGKIALAFSATDNGTQILQLVNDIDLQYKKGASTFILLNNVGFMTADEEELINSGFQHLRYNYTVKDSSFFTLETFVQHQYNPVKLLVRRFLFGIGPRFRIINSDKISFYIGTLPMFEYEQLSDNLETITELIRFDGYMSLNFQITDNISFGNITYYQPNFENFDDYRVSSETSIKFKITNALKFKVSYQTTYDSDPPEDVTGLFYKFKNTLSYSF